MRVPCFFLSRHLFSMTPLLTFVTSDLRSVIFAIPFAKTAMTIPMTAMIWFLRRHLRQFRFDVRLHFRCCSYNHSHVYTRWRSWKLCLLFLFSVLRWSTYSFTSTRSASIASASRFSNSALFPIVNKPRCSNSLLRCLIRSSLNFAIFTIFFLGLSLLTPIVTNFLTFKFK